MKTKYFSTLFVFLIVLALTFGATGITSVQAAALTVQSAADDGTANAANCPGAGCRLRDTLAAAAAGDTITFDPGLAGQTIYLASTLTISKNVTIDGAALATSISISGDSNKDGTGEVVVFSIDSGVTVMLNSLTITRGFASSQGGGIINDGTLTVDGCTFANNISVYDGGAILNNKNLTVNNSTFSTNVSQNGSGGAISSYFDYSVLTVTNSSFAGNTADNNGGAIESAGSATVTTSIFSNNHAGFQGGAFHSSGSSSIITDSTFSGNSVPSGDGGAIVAHGSLIVANTTFSGNAAGYGGGAIYNTSAGTIAVTNSTFSGNSANSGGAIGNYNSTLTLKNATLSGNIARDYGGAISFTGTLNLYNTILANSSGGDCRNFGGSIGTNRNNLVMDGSCAANGVNFRTGDPQLGALADNGGPTKTMAIQAGSLPFNAGDDTTCAAAPVGGKDQRGFTRPQGAHCDIGAFEQDNFPIPTVEAFSAPSNSSSLDIPISAFSASDTGGVTGYLITTSAVIPEPSNPGWSVSAPSTYHVPGDNIYSLYPWAKNAVGVVSAVYGSPQSVTVETASPSVLSSNRAHANPTSKKAVNFTVTFSEPVTGVDVTDFTLTATGSISGYSVASLSGSGAIYTVTVNTGSQNGTLRLDVLNDGSIKDQVNNPLSAAFSAGQVYTVQKVRTFYSIAYQDGWVLQSTSGSTVGGTFNVNTTLNLGDDALNRQYRSILSFSTASLPDTAKITKVTLKFKRSGIFGGVTFSMFQGLLVEIKKAPFGLPALQATDFQSPAQKTYGPFSPIPANAWYSITLPSAGSYVNLLTNSSGLTQFRLRFQAPTNSNNLANYYTFFSGNAAADSRPLLIIEYYTP